MRRIAYVSADLGVPVFGQKGCSIHVQEVLRALAKRGMRIDLFTPRSEGEPPDDFNTVRVHPLPCPAKGDPAAREQAALEGNETLRAVLEREGSFDCVYERYSLWSFAAMEFARDRGVPGLLEVNSPLIEEQSEYRILVDRTSARRVAERVFAAATRLLCVSEEVAEYLNGFDRTQGKIHVVSNGTRPERFSENIEPALPAAAGVFTVGFVGTLKPWHGLSVLIEAFALLHERRKQTRLLIVGDGPERDELVAQVNARGLRDAARFTGGVAPNRVPALLASMDVAVAPYPRLPRFYFSPLKVYEYMAAGVPVVASRIGQVEKLIDADVNGLLVPPGDPAALAAALERLHAAPELRVRLGHAARRTVLHEYTWDKVAQRILDLAELN